MASPVVLTRQTVRWENLDNGVVLGIVLGYPYSELQDTP